MTAHSASQICTILIQEMYVYEHLKKNQPADATPDMHLASDNQHRQKSKSFN